METELVSKNSTIDQQARLLEEQGRAIKAFMQAESATEFITATERIAQEKEEAGHELEFLREWTVQKESEEKDGKVAAERRRELDHI